MDIRTEHMGDKSVIIIEKNKLIGIEGDEFQNSVKDSIDKGSKNISVDLTKVEYISSWGIGILVHAYTTCLNNNINYSLQGVNSRVKSVLNQLKLTELLNII